MLKLTHMITIVENLRKISRRRINVFLIASIISAVTLGIFNFTRTFALEGAKWANSDKNAIVYNQKTFTKTTDTSRLPKDAQGGTAFINTSQATASGEQTAEVISVKSTESDKIEGKLYKFKVSVTGNYKQEGQAESITGQGVSETDPTKSETSCAIEGGGGWAVCMISNTLAGAMDGLYNIVSDFLKVQPLQTSDKSGLYRVWDYMRNIANIFFVIVFILIIYSQITNVGISNYGIKKMLPKLIIAAILINVSYYICALAVDLSNILGVRLQDLLVGVRKDIFESGSGIQIEALSWKSLVVGILSGAGAITMGAWSFVLAGGPQNLGLMMMFVLLIVLYSVFVAVVILAARQAIITVLIFLAPLAFVANIWPNTEKWFDKWKDLFTTMLVMYPLIALLFGGSQLAGIAIIANANGNIVTLILGMVVQVVPLAITPTIMKLSGNLLGKFAGMINNPNKGPIDTSKKFLKDQMDIRTNQKIRDNPNSLTAKANQVKFNRSRRVNSAKSIGEQYQQSRFDNMEAKKIEEATSRLGTDPNVLNSVLKNNTAFQENLVAQEIANSTNRKNAAISGLNAEILTELKKGIKITDGEVKISNPEDLRKNFGSVATRIFDTMNTANAHKLAEQNNKAMIADSLANNLQADNHYQSISEGQRGNIGRSIALGAAFDQSKKIHNDEVAALRNLSKHLKMSKEDRDDIFLNKNDGEKLKVNGFELEVSDTWREAVAEDWHAAADFGDSFKALTNKKLASISGANADAWDKSGKKDGAKILGAGFKNAIASGAITDFDTSMVELAKSMNKISGESLATMDDSAVKFMLSNNILSDIKSGKYKEIDGAHVLKNLEKSIKDINDNQKLFNKINANLGDEIHRVGNKVGVQPSDMSNIKTKK